jgi:hypothetical protein
MHLLRFGNHQFFIVAFNGFSEITEKFGLPDALLVHTVHPIRSYSSLLMLA